MTSAADIAACKEMLRGGSRTFFAASRVLPRSVSEPAIALYAFCRLADDEVDLCGGKMEAIAHLKDRLARAYAQQPSSSPADRAFADIVAQFSIPRELPEALLEGLTWDAEGRRYRTLCDLIEYAVRVAGTVGAMMSLLMGGRESAIVARACDLGIAMQLTNIARDVGEDARAGRLYLPLQWMRDEGLDSAAWLSDPQHDARIGRVISRLLSVADVFYERSIAGIGALPRSCRPGIHAARLIYAEIGREVERHNCDSVSQRAVVSSSRKLRLLALAFARSFGPEEMIAAHVEPASRFLIDAVASSELSAKTPRRSPVERAIWVLGLFERLERRDQLLRSNSIS